MKILRVTIEAVDSDHDPIRGGWKGSIGSKVPFITAGKIIAAIEGVMQIEGCKLLMDEPIKASM